MNSNILFELIQISLESTGIIKYPNITNYTWLKDQYYEHVQELLNTGTIDDTQSGEYTFSNDFLKNQNHKKFRISSKSWKAFVINERIKDTILRSEKFSNILGSTNNLTRAKEHYMLVLNDLISRLSKSDLNNLFYINKNILLINQMWIHDPHLMIHRAIIQELFLKNRVFICHKIPVISAQTIFLYGNGFNLSLSNNIDYSNKSIILISKNYDNMLGYNINIEEHQTYLKYLSDIAKWINDKIHFFGYEAVGIMIDGNLKKLYDLDHNYYHELLHQNRYNWYKLLKNSSISEKIKSKKTVEDYDIGIEDYYLINTLKNDANLDTYTRNRIFSKIIGATIHYMSSITDFKFSHLSKKFRTNKIFTTNYDHNFEKSFGRKSIHLHGSVQTIRYAIDKTEIVSDEDLFECLKNKLRMELIIGSDGNDKRRALIFDDKKRVDYFDVICNRAKSIHIFGYSGENDSHINQIINRCTSFKNIYIYIKDLKNTEQDNLRAKSTWLSDTFLSVHNLGRHNEVEISPKLLNRTIYLIDSNMFVSTFMKQ